MVYTSHSCWCHSLPCLPTFLLLPPLYASIAEGVISHPVCIFAAGAALLLCHLRRPTRVRALLPLPNGALLSGGCDRCIRHWDCCWPERSYIIAGPVWPDDRGIVDPASHRLQARMYLGLVHLCLYPSSPILPGAPPSLHPCCLASLTHSLTPSYPLMTHVPLMHADGFIPQTSATAPSQAPLTAPPPFGCTLPHLPLCSHQCRHTVTAGVSTVGHLSLRSAAFAATALPHPHQTQARSWHRGCEHMRRRMLTPSLVCTRWRARQGGYLQAQAATVSLKSGNEFCCSCAAFSSHTSRLRISMTLYVHSHCHPFARLLGRCYVGH